jgi:hypothetical protein
MESRFYKGFGCWLGMGNNWKYCEMVEAKSNGDTKCDALQMQLMDL